MCDIEVDLSDSQYKLIKELAKKDGLSIEHYIACILKEFVEKETKKLSKNNGGQH